MSLTSLANCPPHAWRPGPDWRSAGTSSLHRFIRSLLTEETLDPVHETATGNAHCRIAFRRVNRPIVRTRTFSAQQIAGIMGKSDAHAVVHSKGLDCGHRFHTPASEVPAIVEFLIAELVPVRMGGKAPPARRDQIYKLRPYPRTSARRTRATIEVVERQVRRSLQAAAHTAS